MACGAAAHAVFVRSSRQAGRSSALRLAMGVPEAREIA
jgi:hypothetical protein